METITHIHVGNVLLEGVLGLPEKPLGLVLFAHGSGSGRNSPRNRFVAHALEKAHIATLLVDLLSEEEDMTYETRFNIPLLTARLTGIMKWLQKNPTTQNLSVGLFGASTGAAAALEAAAVAGSQVKAVVSRGGRPDMAMRVLPQVISPTLFIVGGNDFGVIELNQSAFDQLSCVKEFRIIPGATHLFEEPGCLEQVAQLATSWFQYHLPIQIKEKAK